MSTHETKPFFPSVPEVQISDPFWSPFTRLVQEVVLPYQWEALNDRVAGAQPSYAIHNFKVAAGVIDGAFGGLIFQDSDLAKWIEAVGHTLRSAANPQLEAWADEVIDLIAKAQHADGYLNTYFTLVSPDKRFTNLADCHELYCAGHMMEAAVAYFEGTGKRHLLDVMCRFADYIDTVFGPEAQKQHGYPGHQEIELALVQLYRVTGEPRYLRLSQYFIDERGQSPYFHLEWEARGRTSHWSAGQTPAPVLSYNQSHQPVREQTEAVGHAVRAVYMYTAMADLARISQDRALAGACKTLWDNITHQQMYITGGIGSTRHGEAFTFAYDLPNHTVYAETCAAIGLIFFAKRMLQLAVHSEYADVLERALYNTVTSGISQDGQSYFYVNPLEVWPEASEKNPDRHHVRPVRQKWFGCACCPPNIARLLASLGDYIYTVEDTTLYTHLYIGGTASVGIAGASVQVSMDTDYPWQGMIRQTFTLARPTTFCVALRVPGWCDKYALRVNGVAVLPGESGIKVADGYIRLQRVWQDGDHIELHLDIHVQVLSAHPNVRANAGRVALQRGPLVYCLEEVDNAAPLSALSLDVSHAHEAHAEHTLENGAIAIELAGYRDDDAASRDTRLYRPAQTEATPITIRAIPYYMWGNREPGEMQVWVRAR